LLSFCFFLLNFLLDPDNCLALLNFSHTWQDSKDSIFQADCKDISSIHNGMDEIGLEEFLTWNDPDVGLVVEDDNVERMFFHLELLGK
jgi:hypothetical protein